MPIIYPKVSIVVPVYNTSKYVVRCLRSIELQSLEDYEVLIINDGSTDNSEEVCLQFIAGKARFRLINKQNGGLTSARLCGWKMAKGKYIVFVDSDDFIEADYCKDLYNACETTDSKLAICSYQVVTDDGISYTACLPFKDSVITNIQDEYIKPLISYSPQTKTSVPGFLWLRMMLRDAITEDCFVDENKVFTEDKVFDLLYAQHINKIAVVQRPLYNYYQAPGSLTHKYRPNLWKMYQNLYELCREYCEKNDIYESSHYLFTLLMVGILHCVQQAVGNGCYTDFKKEYCLIRSEEKTKGTVLSAGLWSKELRQMTLNHKIIYLMLRFAHPRIVYHFYKWRQTR